MRPPHHNRPLSRKAPGFSLARFLKVARQLEDTHQGNERRMYASLKLALLGKTDALSQASMMWVLICPQFIEALDADPACWLEHTILYVLGKAFMGWDMPNLTNAERAYRIELCEAVLAYSLGGEQLYLPFSDESDKGTEPGLVGILATKIGPFTSQNILAFLQNGAARRQFRQQYPTQSAMLVELSLNNNDCENFFSLIAQQLGYKPRLVEFEARAQLLDYALHEEFDPERTYQIMQSRRKRYDMCTFYLAQAVTDWNNGAALDPRSKAVRTYLLEVMSRAVRASKGKYESLHAQHKKAATGARR